MGHADYYAPGSYNQECDICRRKFKAFETTLIKANIRQEKACWVACPDCVHELNPQDLVEAKADKQTVPIPRPDGEPEFIE